MSIQIWNFVAITQKSPVSKVYELEPWATEGGNDFKSQLVQLS